MGTPRTGPTSVVRGDVRHLPLVLEVEMGPEGLAPVVPLLVLGGPDRALPDIGLGSVPKNPFRCSLTSSAAPYFPTPTPSGRRKNGGMGSLGSKTNRQTDS